jgi:hypothetical protein
MKVVSSLTLFGHIAKELYTLQHTNQHASLARAADVVLMVAASEGYPPCRYTLDHLRR